MSRFSEEMKIIPKTAWWIAGIIGGGIIATCVALALRGHPEALLFSIIGVIFVPYILFIGYIAGDSKRRGMRSVLWTLLAVFVPNMIGIILYFIMRDPLQRSCLKCGAATSSAFPFCPSCGATVAPACPSCRTAVEPAWSHCAHCGSVLLDGKGQKHVSS
jgi:hypothetical protein